MLWFWVAFGALVEALILWVVYQAATGAEKASNLETIKELKEEVKDLNEVLTPLNQKLRALEAIQASKSPLVASDIADGGVFKMIATVEERHLVKTGKDNYQIFTNKHYYTKAGQFAELFPNGATLEETLSYMNERAYLK